ncbi:MAG TPA: hypothetical protein VEY51_04140 [Chondromyces sp.]|nr:hypothetical protein [Chondromyces sp.]
MRGKASVLAYENPYTFHQGPEFQPYIDCPHICATKSLEIGVKERFELPHVQSAGAIVDLFYPGWNSPENRFTQYAQLSDILRNWEDVHHPKVIRSFKRNRLNLLITMRNLTEIGLTPYDVRPNTTKVEEKIFCDIWEAMQPNFKAYMLEAAEKVKDIDEIRKTFEKAGVPLTKNSVVLHGFYYISPVQHFLFAKWKELGVNLVFLTLFHENHPTVFSFLKENFSRQYGWAEEGDWQIIRDTVSVGGASFASRFEGKEVPSGPLTNVTERPYDYIVEFVEDLKDGTRYVSPNSDALKERIKEFRPESFLEERHFLAYPIGQYLFHLHSVWDEDRQGYMLTEKILMESFASGWLEADGENAREYTAELKALLPYFSDCRTVAQWMARFQTLVDAKRASIQPFKRYNLKKNDFLGAVRISPVLRFSYFSISIRVMKKIQALVEKLVNDATWLVNIEEERVTIKTHFRRIRQLLEDSNFKTSLANDIEKKLVNQLEELLAKPVHDEQSYHVGDLSEAILVFLKTGLEDPDQDMIGSLDGSSDGNEGGSREKTLHLYKMADLDGLILRNGMDELHLCGMDEESFPETNTPIPWPLSFDLISKLDNRPADMYVFRRRHSLAFSRYLFFVALCFEKDIRFSWVKNWGEYEGLDRSIYTQLLDLPLEKDRAKEDYEYVAGGVSQYDPDMEMIQKRIGELPQEEFAEMSLCKKRFTYSSLVDGFASYHNSFHQSFLIGNLVKIYASIGKTKTEIIDILSGLFPYMTDIMLRTIIDQNMNENYVAGMRKYGLGKRRTFRDIDYPESMLYFQFLTHRGAFQNEHWQSAFTPPSGIRRQKADHVQQMAAQSGALAEATPSELCKLCPHAGYCEDAYYAVDIPKEGFDDYDHGNGGV